MGRNETKWDEMEQNSARWNKVTIDSQMSQV